MYKRAIICIATAALLLLVVFSGCTSQKPPASVPSTTVIQTSSPSTPAPVATAVPVAAADTAKPAKSIKVILVKSGTITPKSYQTYDFKSMGDEFSKIGVDYKIELSADKPLLGYAVTNIQADQLGASELTPKILPGTTDKIDWGLITPYWVLDRVTSNSKTFSVTKEAPYVYVVDGRMLATGNATTDSVPVKYTITITKIS